MSGSSFFRPTYYSVSIAFAGASAPADGFIDDTKIQNYLTQNSDALPGDFTLALSQAKRRANLRYRQMVQQLGLMCNVYITGNTATGADYKTAATTYSFTLCVERGDSVLSTPDELNAGQYLTGTAAIKRCIARAFVAGPSNTDWVYEIDVFDPTGITSAGTWGAATSLPRFGSAITTLTVGHIAANLTAAAALVTITTGTDPYDWQ